jgi:hypothetical protein
MPKMPNLEDFFYQVDVNRGMEPVTENVTGQLTGHGSVTGR